MSASNRPNFTRGPFRVDTDATGARVYGEGIEVADCRAFCAEELPMVQANARLISAAPEMYEALLRIVEAQDYSIRYATDAMRDEFEPEWCKLARAAIAKAQGA